MSSSRSPGPLTEFLKQADITEYGVRAIGSGIRAGVGAAKSVGHGVWNVAGHLAPNPMARAGLLGAAALGGGMLLPSAANTLSNGARYVRGETSTPRG